MSERLSDVATCLDRLIGALDCHEVAAVEQATGALEQALADLRTEAGELSDADQSQLRLALRSSDAARVRVRILSDWTRQRLDRLAELRGSEGRARAALYAAPKASLLTR